MYTPYHVQVSPTGMPTATYPNEIVGIDTVGPLTMGEGGNRYLITLIDHATGWAEAYPAKDRNAEHPPSPGTP